MITGRDGLLEETDRAVQSYRLDDRQINFVNKISKGNQLILACAGSGKSVLLISRESRLELLCAAWSWPHHVTDCCKAEP